MALRVRFVKNLDEVVKPVVEYLTTGSHGVDLFKAQDLIVPTAGVRAWLAPKVAAKLGATGNANDGILSNVRIGYIGMLNQILRNGVEDDSDSWSIERITMAVLRVIHDRDPEKDPFIRKHGGHLRAARAMADRFDRYAARRPQLIRQWEEAFVTNAEVGRDNAQEESQYALWKQVRGIIGVPSWPERTREICARLRAGEPVPGIPRRLMVAGVESMSVANLEILQALGHAIDVEVLVVHPSPELARVWAGPASSQQVTPGLAPRRADEAHVVADSDMLVTTWLRGSFELQMLLASQGITAHPHEPTTVAAGDKGLLGRMHQVIASPGSVQDAEVLPTGRSVQIHRTHNLARQVEVLRDSLLHAFHDLRSPALTPDQVVILCADIEAAAPLLRATFDQAVQVASGAKVKIPLVIADRSLRDTSEGAKLLADVLALVGSRFDVKSVMRVATNDLVLRCLRLGSDDVDVWTRHIETTRVRWGIDPSHRVAQEFSAKDITTHTWKQLLDRAILGALLPDADSPAHELGGVVPLVQVETADLDALSGLAQVLAVLAELERRAREPQSVGVWCDSVEEALVALCGESCMEIDDVLAIIQSFRDSSVLIGPTGPVQILDAVNFADFADLLLQKVSGIPGHQPLRTGAVTATSFVPLRSVPFRVVCVVGLDDGTLAAGESEGDDLVANDPLMGDPDPRVDTRRVLLDAVVAASDQLIITCNGRSIKNNGHVPMVTPLAELLDFCERLGVIVPDDPEKPSEIEHIHPRHASGRGNFTETRGPVEGRVWSHDIAALNAARSLFADPAPRARTVTVGAPLTEVPLKKLEDIVLDPLAYYMRETLKVYTEYEEEEPGAVLPVKMTEFETARLAEDLVKAAGDGKIGDVVVDWMAVANASDSLPVGKFAEQALAKAVAVAVAVRGRADGEGIPKVDPEPLEFKLKGADGTSVDCKVPRVTETQVYSVVYHTKTAKELTRLGMRLLALHAAGRSVERAVLVQRDETQKLQMVDVVTIDPEMSQEEALRRLVALAKSEPVVRTTPCGVFGQAGGAVAASGALDDDTVVQAMEEFVDGRDFARSAELLVFGPNPDITHAYPKDSAELLDFFIALDSVGAMEKVDGKDTENQMQKWEIK